jgi:Mrp family chromosome partitioning ATPase
MSTTLARKNGAPATTHPPVEVLREDAPVTDQPLVESFRLLALNVDRLLPDPAQRSVLVLSARADDGRSLVASSLVTALAEICPRVLLVKADPIGSEDGLASKLARTTDRGWIKVADCSRPGKASQSDFVGSVLEAIEEGLSHGATVVVDAPACTTSTVAFHLAPAVGGVLYLARQRAESSDIHHDIRAQLDLLGANILGLVFNEG